MSRFLSLKAQDAKRAHSRRLTRSLILETLELRALFSIDAFELSMPQPEDND
jgi:hypothetical protein